MKGNIYRDHRCDEISREDIGTCVRLAGWVDVIRDHGGVIFIDLRDQFGITQVVVHDEELLKDVHKETVIMVSGEVIKRDEETINLKLSPS